MLIGGPGTGKTTVLKRLKNKGFTCMPEISRQVTKQAQKDGIEQLFLTKPLLFSQKLLEGREQQFLDADKTTSEIIFFDRGIPSVYAYLQYFKTESPAYFLEKSNQYKYQKVFLFKPWKKIYKRDNERYETYEESVKITSFIEKTYKDLGYKIIDVPFGDANDRRDFILNSLSLGE